MVTQICFNLHLLMIYDVEHRFICFFANCISSLLKVLVWAAIKITIDWVAYEKQKSISHSSGEWKCEIMETEFSLHKERFN